MLTFIKSVIPLAFRERVRWLWQHRDRLCHWGQMLVSRASASNTLQVFYGHIQVPTRHDHAYGGMVKFQRMQESFPNSPYRFNILYMVSSWRPKDWQELLWLARRKQAKIVWNQNGVGYPAWCGEKYEKINAPMRAILHEADYVLYQSRFCKRSADHFLGERQDRYEILYNAVDTTVFTPAESDPDPNHLVLLLGGSQYQYYRIETAIRTLSALARMRDNVRLIITGTLSWASTETEAESMIRTLITELHVVDMIRFTGVYTQQQAPSLYSTAHILLHTKYNDPCPGLVIEAMSCGLPVVYSASGGVPELLGNEAGIGVASELSWEQDFPPTPEKLADAVLRVAERRKEFAEAARQRAVEKFDLQPWLQRHHEVFTERLRT